MEDYIAVLTNARRAVIFETVLTVVFFIFLVVLVSLLRYKHLTGEAKGSKKKKNKKTVSKKTFVLLKSLGLALIVLLGAVMSYGDIWEISLINKDIKEKSFSTYHGEYKINSDLEASFSTSFYARWRTVTLEDDGAVLSLHIKSFGSALTTDGGAYSGKIVYAENSEIVVDISKF